MIHHEAGHRLNRNLPSDLFSSQSSSTNEQKFNIPAMCVAKPIPFFDQATKIYRDDPPPFVYDYSDSRRRPANLATKSVYLATSSGEYPEHPTSAVVVAHEWSNGKMYWTLDADEVRYIVKWFPGGRHGGGRYRAWYGVREDFATTTIAFLANEDSTGISKDKKNNESSGNDKTSPSERTLDENQTRHMETSIKVPIAQREKHRNHLNPVSHHPTPLPESSKQVENLRATVFSLPIPQNQGENYRSNDHTHRISDVGQGLSGRVRTARPAGRQTEIETSST